MKPELFSATDRQLERDRIAKQALILAIPMSLALAWAAWLFLGHVSVYASTDQARVEVAQAAYLVQAPVSGRVVRSFMELGRQVDRGAVLVELEAGPQQLRLQEEEAHQAALEAELSTLKQALAAEGSALDDEQSAGRAATEQARAALAKAEDAAQFAREEAGKRAELFRSGLASELDYLRSQSDARQKQSDLKAARTAVQLAERERLMHRDERRTAMETTSRDVVSVEGELAASRDTIERLQHDLGLQRIVASGPGRLGEIANLRSGAYIREGDRLAAIIPEGRLHVVAYFEPRDAIGLIKPGQKAWLRLDGFPWAEYGSVRASVRNVGDELRDGRVRVELDLARNPRVPLQHGLPGTLEVEVNRIPAAAFLLRKADGYLGHPQQTEVASR